MHIPEDGYLLRIFVGESDKHVTVACRLPQTTLEKAKVKESKTNWVTNAGSLRGVEVGGVTLVKSIVSLY